MLRTTISRIKRVCTIAFIPRVLRGDQRCAPVSYAVIRIAPKSTKPPDDSDPPPTDKENDGANFMLPSGEEIKIEDNKKKRPLTHHERCKRIIEKAFGSADGTDDPEQAVSEQYCSHSVNIEETKREIIESEKATLKLKEAPTGTPIVPDDRTRYGIFKMSRELVYEDEGNEPLTEEVAPVKETSEIRASTVRVVREPDLSKSLETVEKAQESPKQSGLTEFEKDVNKQDNIQETEESTKLSDEDAQAMELLKENYQMEDDSVNILDAPKIVNATTTKEVEEELSQKLEEIDETPLVEDEKPKIEGFNTTAKVLADIKPTYALSSDNMQQIDDYTDAVDEVAKRCLQSPIGKIDEMLVNELENLEMRTNVCDTGSKSPSMDIEDELVRMNAIKNQLKDTTHQDDAVDMRLRSAEPTGEINPTLPDLNEKSDKVVLENQENLFAKAELADEASILNVSEDVTSDQKLSKNVTKTKNRTNEVINLNNFHVMPLEPQSIAADGARLPSPDNELSPSKHHKRKILFKTNKKPLNPEYTAANIGFAIDDVTPMASYNKTYPKTVDRETDPFSLEHPSERRQITKALSSENPLLERNDAKDEQKMSESLHQLQIETDAAEEPKISAEIVINAVPDNCRILDETGDEQPVSYDTETCERMNREILNNNESTAEEIPRNVEHVNVAGTRIEAHDPDFLENIKREIAAPLTLNEPTIESNVNAEQKTTENVHLVNVEAAEVEVEKTPFEPSSNVIDNTRISNNTSDKQAEPVYNYNQAPFLKEDNRSESVNTTSSHNLTFTNVVDHHRPPLLDNSSGEHSKEHSGEHPLGFEKYGQPPRNPSEFKKELEDAVASTQNAVNRLFAKIPFTNFRLPNSKWDITNLVKRRDKVAPPPPPDDIYLEKSVTIDEPHQETKQDTGKAILPNAILKQADSTCMTSPKTAWAHKKGANLVEDTENIDMEDFQAKRSMDERPVFVMGNEKLKQPELDLRSNETCTVSQRPVSSSVSAYAFKKGTELVDADENADDFQAKRSLDYDLVMESEKIKKHKLNLICEESCATSPKPIGLGDIALAYEKGTNLVDDNDKNEVDISQVLRFEDCDLVTESENSKQHELDLTRDETCTTPPEQDSPSDTRYSYNKGTNLVIATENIEDFQAKRSLDDMVMECENPPQEEIQAIVRVQAQPSLDNMPSLAEDVALSELLRRVRQRSRLMAFSNDCKTLAVEVVPAEGKCDRRAPRCPPTAPRSPPNNPVPPPSFGLPMLKRRPPACKPRRKPSTTKCSACDLSKLGTPQNMDMFCETDDACGLLVSSSQVDLTEVVIDRLQTLGRTLAGVLRQVKSQVETMFARDYEPWVPIPSWPIPKKVEKPKVQPGYHGVPPCVTGCPVIPKPNVSRNPEPRCLPRPCDGFPRRTFSMLDCFTVSLGENQVYDLGQF